MKISEYKWIETSQLKIDIDWYKRKIVHIMGITGLLPFLKNASRPASVDEFSGKVAAVDVYCWLHK